MSKQMEGMLIIDLQIEQRRNFLWFRKDLYILKTTFLHSTKYQTHQAHMSGCFDADSSEGSINANLNISTSIIN